MLPTRVARSAEISVDCGRKIGDQIYVQLRGHIERGDASKLRDQFRRCHSEYDVEAIRRQADAVEGRNARKTRAALDAKADAIEAQNLVFGIPSGTLYLDSDSGDPAEGIEIGRVARQERLTTIVDVNRKCSDACLLAFIGGAVRKTSWDADIRTQGEKTSWQDIFSEVNSYAISMGVPKQAIGKLSSGPPRRLAKNVLFDLGVAGADSAYISVVKTAFTEPWGQDATELMEAAKAYQAIARACAEKQSDVSPINHGFVACLTSRAEPLQRWKRYLIAVRTIDALQHATGRHGLPNHRFFVDIAGDWGF